MSKVIISIDPGKYGAWAMFDEGTGEFRHVGDLPIVEDQSLAWVDGQRFPEILRAAANEASIIGLIERITPNPKNGSIAGFSQGQTLASSLSALQFVGARVEFVSPQKWKRALGLTRTGVKLTDTERKKASLSKARLLYPMAPLPLEKHHNRAEAILLGHWYLQNRIGWKAA